MRMVDIAQSIFWPTPAPSSVIIDNTTIGEPTPIQTPFQTPIQTPAPGQNDNATFIATLWVGIGVLSISNLFLIVTLIYIRRRQHRDAVAQLRQFGRTLVDSMRGNDGGNNDNSDNPTRTGEA